MNTKNIEIIREPFNVFSAKLTDINFYKSFIESKVKDLKEKNLEQQKIKSNIQIDNYFIHSSNYTCYSPYDGIIRVLGNKADTVESRMQTIEYHYSKQCQWLLVEAYEDYERYLKNLYAYIGYIDNSFWRASDFGNISIDEIQGKDILWFRNHHNKKTNEILKQIRKKIPEIVNTEKITGNELRVPLNLTTIIIEQLRHLIVHSNGITENKREFIEKIIKKSGLFRNERYDPIIFENIDRFFDANTIKLKTIYSKKINTLGVKHEVKYDGFNDLLSKLGSHTLIIQQEVESYLINKKSNGDRLL